MPAIDRRLAGLAVQDRSQVLGRPLRHRGGERLGTIRDAWCPDDNPYVVAWVVVTLGPWRTRRRVVPLVDAEWDPSGITVPYPRAVLASMSGAATFGMDDADLLLSWATAAGLPG